MRRPIGNETLSSSAMNCFFFKIPRTIIISDLMRLIIALCKIYCPLPHCVHEKPEEDGKLSAAEGFSKAV